MPARLTAFILFSLCASFLAACDSTEKRDAPTVAPQSAPAPPVITERFTLMPCPASPKSTLDFEGCAEHRILKSDRAINAVARKIFRQLATTTARARFVRAERAWLTYRRAACQSNADLFEGGSAAGIVFAECVAAKNGAYLRDLRVFERRLRHKASL
jgi:uncharacterized protein YecT (DUF1311 family)